MLDATSSHPLYGGILFFGVSTETNGYVMKMDFFRSCAHDLCRWYQDYRNAQKNSHSIRKQLLESDSTAYPRCAFNTGTFSSSNRINIKQWTFMRVSSSSLPATSADFGFMAKPRNVSSSMTFLFGWGSIFFQLNSSSMATFTASDASWLLFYGMNPGLYTKICHRHPVRQYIHTQRTAPPTHSSMPKSLKL